MIYTFMPSSLISLDSPSTEDSHLLGISHTTNDAITSITNMNINVITALFIQFKYYTLNLQKNDG